MRITVSRLTPSVAAVSTCVSPAARNRATSSGRPRRQALPARNGPGLAPAENLSACLAPRRAERRAGRETRGPCPPSPRLGVRFVVVLLVVVLLVGAGREAVGVRALRPLAGWLAERSASVSRPRAAGAAGGVRGRVARLSRHARCWRVTAGRVCSAIESLVTALAQSVRFCGTWSRYSWRASALAVVVQPALLAARRVY